jgi:hypothetical protein
MLCLYLLNFQGEKLMHRGIILLDERSPIIQYPNFEKDCPIESVNYFINQNKIEVAILNPQQLTRYYTRPFALYFDLRNDKKAPHTSYDYLIIHIHQAFQKFTDTYPEYWGEIKNSFKNVQYLN